MVVCGASGARVRGPAGPWDVACSISRELRENLKLVYFVSKFPTLGGVGERRLKS